MASPDAGTSGPATPVGSGSSSTPNPKARPGPRDKWTQAEIDVLFDLKDRQQKDWTEIHAVSNMKTFCLLPLPSLPPFPPIFTLARPPSPLPWPCSLSKGQRIVE